MTAPSPQLTDLGVYRLDHVDRNPTFLVALKNDDDGDYSFALAPALAIPGAGFTYNDSEILIFLSKDLNEGIYTSYDDTEGPLRPAPGIRSHQYRFHCNYS
jgi:hypothetical protein